MKLTPTEIKRVEGTGVKVRWSNGLEDFLDSALLRTYCPCASCLEKRGEGQAHQTPLTAAAPSLKKKSLSIVTSSVEEEFNLVQIWGVGNYAIGMEWKDGHTTGIYTFDYLRQLGELKNGSEKLQ